MLRREQGPTGFFRCREREIGKTKERRRNVRDSTQDPWDPDAAIPTTLRWAAARLGLTTRQLSWVAPVAMTTWDRRPWAFHSFRSVLVSFVCFFFLDFTSPAGNDGLTFQRYDVIRPILINAKKITDLFWFSFFSISQMFGQIFGFQCRKYLVTMAAMPSRLNVMNPILINAKKLRIYFDFHSFSISRMIWPDIRI